ncbi:hypothetical protein G3N57_01435 [Paraburkholderia sp. Se-20369]|nr:hypothetical protein [Paraburkholderia sp. Se-20369]
MFQPPRGADHPGKPAKKVVAASDELISELLPISAPMYNPNVPSSPTNRFGLVAHAQVTFRYAKTCPVGLVEGVKAANSVHGAARP